MTTLAKKTKFCNYALRAAEGKSRGLAISYNEEIDLSITEINK